MAEHRDAAAASSAYALSETVNRVHQDQLYDQRMQLKRAAPTPAASSAATPQAETPVATTGTVVVAEPERVQPVTLDDHTAFQATASVAGVNINDPSQVEAYAQQQVKTVQDVFNVVRSYHTAVIRPEMRGMIKQLEYSIRNVEDSVFNCQRELQFMVTENRSTQKHASGLMLVTTGWPNELGPEKRVYMLGWMLSNTPEVVKHLQNMGLLANPCDHTALKPQFWFNILAQDPVTVPQGAGRFSGMTLLTFKAWEMRSAFLKQYGGQSGTPLYIDEATPQPNRHARVSPCTPQWQRKLEMPLRVLIQALNNHPETTGKRLVILWKTLTIMAPTENRDFLRTTPPGLAFFTSRAEVPLRPDLKSAESLRQSSPDHPRCRGRVRRVFGQSAGTMLFGAPNLSMMMRRGQHTTPPSLKLWVAVKAPPLAKESAIGAMLFCIIPRTLRIRLIWSLSLLMLLPLFGTNSATRAERSPKKSAPMRWPLTRGNLQHPQQDPQATPPTWMLIPEPQQQRDPPRELCHPLLKAREEATPHDGVPA